MGANCRAVFASSTGGNGTSGEKGRKQSRLTVRIPRETVPTNFSTDTPLEAMVRDVATGPDAGAMVRASFCRGFADARRRGIDCSENEV